MGIEGLGSEGTDPLRIALVSPLFESVPPQLYGGTERVVSWLAEELVRQGHRVTLFASGDSVTAAELRPLCDQALRLSRTSDPLPPQVLMLEEVIESAPEFDVIHFHTEHLHLPFVRRFGIPALSTMHSRLDLPELPRLYRRFRDVPLVSISDAQRRPLGFANWLGTVHHGMPRDDLHASLQPGSYLAFLGRISPEKGPERAIRIARRAGIPLKIAAKIDAQDAAYFRHEVRPLFGPGVEFIGEIGGDDKNEFLAGALALLFPIDWPEPFGLVMIEAMACGTPVIAFPCGSVPEVIDDGISGRIVRDEEEAVRAVHSMEGFDRAACRAAFERRFTADIMARKYVDLYRLVQESAVERAVGRMVAEKSAHPIPVSESRSMRTEAGEPT